MVATSTSPRWAPALAEPAQEFGPTPLSVLSGSLPSELSGSLYRNGPGRLERNGVPVGHWFDGDGAILTVHFNQGAATGIYRYVRTFGYVAEEEAGEFLYGGYGMNPPGALWQRWGKQTKNAANTSVLAVDSALLALWEGGWPYALDPKTLETRRMDDLGGLQSNYSFSAHPKRDPQSGLIYNMGVSLGQSAILRVYECAPTGRIQRQAAIPLEGLTFTHDFVIAGSYLAFLISPVRLNPWPLLLQLSTYSDELKWEPHHGTQLILVDRNTLEVACRAELDPWFQWHFSNGYQASDRSVVIDFAGYPDFKINQRLKEVPTGHLQTRAAAAFKRLRVDPQTGRAAAVLDILSSSCEFPIVNPSDVGQVYQKAYLSVHHSSTDTQSDLFDAVGCLDVDTGDLTLTPKVKGSYPSEPVYAPHPTDPNRGWILTVVFNSTTNRSEVWIFNAEGLDQDPVCCLGLPQSIPHSFHGTWDPHAK